MRPINAADPRKAALDEDTPYTTFLPPMDEGFHIGYKPAPGILNDGNQKPGEWLESFSKHIAAEGEDVGYSIPDVLASEQQLRRLARLPRDMAMRRQEMVDYRGVLALLLLWDYLAHDESAATLSLESLRRRPEQDGFAQAVYTALPADRAEEGLKIFALFHPQGENPAKTPLCLLSKAMVVMPAANLGDLSELLPPAVGWYDRDRKRFNDPCPCLDEEMRSLLIQRLRFLQALNEHPVGGSLIYAPEAQLCGLLETFILDIQSARDSWRQRLVSGEESAERELRTRVLTVFGLKRRGAALAERVLATDKALFSNNPLLRTLTPGGVEDVPEPAGEAVLLYQLDGAVFARQSGRFLLEPAGTAEEAEALRRAQAEIALLDSYDESWRQAMIRTLDDLGRMCAQQTGVHPRVSALLTRWRDEYLARPCLGDRNITLRCPYDTESLTLSPLIGQMLGESSFDCVHKPFSDCLMLIDGAEQAPLGGGMKACSVDLGGETLYYAPPLSPEMAVWLQVQEEKDDAFAPRPEAFACRLTADGEAVESSFTIVCRGREGGSSGRITFARVYPLRAQPELGAAFRLPAAALATVTVWPNVRLAANRWQKYYVHTHRPDGVDVWALSSAGWIKGAPYSAQDESGRRKNQRRSWQTACTDRFPAYLMLRRGAFSLGALVNDQPCQLLRREEPAVIAVDFGSIATTVMLRQGDKVQPAALPENLHGTLMTGSASDERYLTEEFIPRGVITMAQPGESTFYSVMDFFTDDPGKWCAALLDGHIYYPQSLNALLRKGESTLYYDLKWNEENYMLRCLRLFLKQVMLQAALSARLNGSETLSWRVSMPGAMPMHRQEAYLDMVRGLARELAEESGVPLNSGCPPVLYALENQADGLYFRSRNEVNAHSGYLNLDVGGSTADLSLWLGGMSYAAAECSLLLGCRHMLYASLETGHADDFEQNFRETAAAQAAQSIAQSIRQGEAASRGRQKNMLMTDDFFAVYAEEIGRVMTAVRAQGRVTYVESLLLFNIGFLFYLAGKLLERADEDEELHTRLPQRMELCIAGNGGQLLRLFSADQTDSLCRLTLAALRAGHPVRAILPVQSTNPKQEVARGLLYDESGLRSALQTMDRWNGTYPAQEGKAAQDETVGAYLLLFRQSFPQAANLLLADIYEDSAMRGAARLTPTAQMELTTITANERDDNKEDDFAMWVRVFTGLKRLWRV